MTKIHAHFTPCELYVACSVFVKELIHFQMKISPSFTHLQAILGVYDFLLSDEHNRRYFNKYPDASELYNGSEQESRV